MDEDVQLNLRQAAHADPIESSGVGLGSRLVALFAGAGLEEPISEWRGHEAAPADAASVAVAGFRPFQVGSPKLVTDEQIDQLRDHGPAGFWPEPLGLNPGLSPDHR